MSETAKLTYPITRAELDEYPHGLIYDRPIFIKQATQTLGKFTCPECGSQAGEYKFSQNHGWCNSCKKTFQSVGDWQSEDGDASSVDYWAWIELVE